MKAKQRIDKIVESVTKKIQEEVTSLIGAELTLSETENTFVSKEEFFDQPSGKIIAVKFAITGEIEGAGCLLMRVKDAIRLGGTLIMLPLNELEQIIANDEYNDETKDSFGEITNIIAGSYTKVFEEMYPKACRFIRKEQEIIIPSKVEIESDEPIGNQLFYQITSSMQLDDIKMGNLTVLLPASAFGLEGDEEKANTGQSEIEEDIEEDQQQVQPPVKNSVEAKEDNNQEVSKKEKPSVDFNIEKHRKRVDAILNECCSKIEEEVSALLGVEIKLQDFENRPISKEQFFLKEVSGKQVLAHMKVTGDLEDKGYLYVDLKDAIRIGGILIMLPPSELDDAISEEDFSEDSRDAYGEIANIISGVYTGIFEESYIKSLRFIRTDIEEVVPLTVNTSSDEPMADQGYYMSCGTITIEGKTYGKTHMLFPLSLLQLEGIEQGQKAEATKSDPATITATRQKARSLPEAEEGTYEDKEKGAEILLMSDDVSEAEKIMAVLERGGYSVKMLSFKNNINNYISNTLKAVFLVMREVNEQTFGVMIKVNSSCSVPLITAGPAWTRTKVIKAVKYGVTDILLTPASEQDIQEKIDNNLVQLAA